MLGHIASRLLDRLDSTAYSAPWLPPETAVPDEGTAPFFDRGPGSGQSAPVARDLRAIARRASASSRQPIAMDISGSAP
jgi:hypothetical protein